MTDLIERGDYCPHCAPHGWHGLPCKRRDWGNPNCECPTSWTEPEETA